jgi:secreted trypsin-like serine protease
MRFARTVLAAGLFCCGCSAPLADEQAFDVEAIVGGTALTAREVEARGLVGLVAVLDGERRGFCSGTVVADDWVLTAAHCARTPRGPVAHVVFAVDIFGEGRETIAVRSFRRHPTADVALVELAQPAPARYARVAVLPQRARSRTGRALEIAGFGRRDDGASSGGRADRLGVIATLAEAGAPLISVTSTRTGACFGDSGGPAYAVAGQLRAVAGVLSNGNPSCRGGDSYVSAGFYEAFLRSVAPELTFLDP